jgi:hypothetical protein
VEEDVASLGAPESASEPIVAIGKVLSFANGSHRRREPILPLFETASAFRNAPHDCEPANRRRSPDSRNAMSPDTPRRARSGAMASSPGAGMASAPPPPDRASLGRAVAALYTSHDPVERLAADEWLQHFLRSDHAWPLSIELLRDATDLTSLEALFCARALHVLLRKSVVKASRTQKSHAVLGENDWVAMRDALLALAWSFSAKVFVGTAGGQVEAPPRSVLTQVSLAISALACKMDNWDPGSVAVDIVRHFTNDGSNQTGQTTTRAPTAARRSRRGTRSFARPRTPRPV